MANRAYLYAQKGEELLGIAEYNYDIPIAFKILLSAKTKRVRSKILKYPFKIALRGDFEKGVERLYAFLDELKNKKYFEEEELENEINATKAFLEKKEGCKYFQLEATEIYEMDSIFWQWNNWKMKKRISKINKEIAEFYVQLDELKREYDKLCNKGADSEQLSKIKEDMIGKIGIREWSEYLFY